MTTKASQHLGKVLHDFSRVDDEVAKSLIEIEDGITALEDRESRRSARRAGDNPRLTIRGGV